MIHSSTRTRRGLGAMLALAACALTLLSPSALAQGVWSPSRSGQPAPPAEPREFRGAWVATVANIDWPSAPGLSPDQQRAEAVAILDAARRMNLNAIVLQVRPSCDAIYPSTLEPWSEFLTGRAGTGPTPAYDPLQFWIEEAHARGIELHAWFNPFRARHPQAKGPDAPTSVVKSRPELVRAYDNLQWMDPGEPEARDHSMRVIMDVVRRYDIDGVHLDDYFYPYPKEGLPFPDDASFRRSRTTLSKSDWRRDNINQFVRRLYEEVKRAKPHVKVGISPFGIWRPGFPPGIQGFDAYEGLAADARLWLRNGWLDYASPQLYWPLAQAPQSYTRLLDWWIANNDQRRHIWVGNFASRVLSESDASDRKGRDSWQPAEILAQVDATRAAAQGPGGAGGNIMFSMVALTQNRQGLADALSRGPYARPALVPASPWLAGNAPLPPAPTLVGISARGDAAVVTFRDASARGGPVRWHVVWTRHGTQTWRFQVVRASQREVTVPARQREGALSVVAVSALDAFGREGDTAVWTTGAE